MFLMKVIASEQREACLKDVVVMRLSQSSAVGSQSPLRSTDVIMLPLKQHKCDPPLQMQTRFISNSVNALRVFTDSSGLFSSVYMDTNRNPELHQLFMNVGLYLSCCQILIALLYPQVTALAHEEQF